MDYKEEYQKALERAKKGLPIDEVFPELKESEDERIRKRIRLCLDECVHSDIIRDYERDECLAYLEKQKYEYEVFEPVESTLEYKMGFKAGVESVKQKEQKPAEWSERDEKILASAISHIADSQCFDHFHDISKDDIYAWLKSLRPSWKPSEEQMAMLRAVLNDNDNITSEAANLALNSLYDDLKKLI